MKKSRIMIIDDEPHNLDILEAMLKQADYDVAAFPRGVLALAAAPELAPDLVLLDIRMPGMDGYEVCRRFQQDPRLNDIPIIFLSALSETKDKLLAFEMGGVDYISKPVSEPEVLARVRTHLLIRSHRLYLEELVRRRTEALQAAHRRLKVLDQAKTHWIGMLSHELTTPLTGIFCAASVLFRRMPADEEVSELRADYDSSCSRIRKLIDDARTLATINVDDSGFDGESVSLAEALGAALAQAQKAAAGVRFAMTLPRSPERAAVRASSGLLQRAFSDLLLTAACCAPETSQVDVTLDVESGAGVVRMTSHGKGLSPDDLETFFEVGEQRTLLKNGADFGLGPALAYRIVQLFDGSVSVGNGADDGVAIEVRLPLRPPATRKMRKPAAAAEPKTKPTDSSLRG